MNIICPFCYKEFKKKYPKQKYCAKPCYLVNASLHPNKGCFKKGHKPWNKDVKGTHFSPETEFKKGREKNDLAPVYSLRRRKIEKGKYCIKFIKIAQPWKWIEYAKFLWIKHYGKIIKGDVVRHINGVSHDDRIGNLIAMPKKDHFFYNFIGSGKLNREKIQYYKNRYITTK